jgi:hypothetical protein
MEAFGSHMAILNQTSTDLWTAPPLVNTDLDAQVSSRQALARGTDANTVSISFYDEDR